jgi:toxin ParE1/3/4
MAYKVIVSPRAQKEIENAIDYYALYSVDAPVNFIATLKEAYSTLETNPFFRVRYKNVRALKIKKFPHSLYFVINENTKVIRVLACFHNKRSPNTRPRH